MLIVISTFGLSLKLSDHIQKVFYFLFTLQISFSIFILVVIPLLNIKNHNLIEMMSKERKHQKARRIKKVENILLI